MKYFDLSHTFVDNMPVFPGDSPTVLKQVTSISKEGYTDHQLTTQMHVGTHMDAPLHMIDDGKHMSDISVDRFSGPGVLIDVRDKTVIDKDVLTGKTISHGSILLFLTGMDKKYKTPEYDTGYPQITTLLAQSIVTAGVKIIGLDMINPDVDESYPIHKILLSNNVLIIENLTNLEALVGIESFEIFAFPIKLHADAAPVRVVARVT